MIISVFVNNFLIVDEILNIINDLKNKLFKRFSMTNFELFSHYLRIFITWTEKFVSLD